MDSEKGVKKPNRMRMSRVYSRGVSSKEVRDSRRPTRFPFEGIRRFVGVNGVRIVKNGTYR